MIYLVEKITRSFDQAGQIVEGRKVSVCNARTLSMTINAGNCCVVTAYDWRKLNKVCVMKGNPDDHSGLAHYFLLSQGYHQNEGEIWNWSDRTASWQKEV